MIYSYLAARREFEQQSRYVSQMSEKTKSAWIEFDYGNSKKKSFTGKFEQTYSFLKVLEQASQEGKIIYKTDSRGFVSIDGHAGPWKK